MPQTTSHPKWQSVIEAADYKKNQIESVQKVYADLKNIYGNSTNAINSMQQLHENTVKELHDQLNILKDALSPANLSVKNKAVVSEELDKFKGSHLNKLEKAHEERIKAVNENDAFPAADKTKIKDALNKHHESEKKAANEHFEKYKKEAEKYHNNLGRLQSYGYVEAHILRPSGFMKDQVAVVGNDKLAERFEEFKKMPPRKVNVSGVELDISAPDSEGKMMVKLPNLYGVAMSSGRTKAFADGLVSTFHAQGCDSITLEGNFPENIKREIWMVANLKDPRMSVSGYAPTAKDEEEFQKRFQAKQQSQQAQKTPQNVSTTPDPVDNNAPSRRLV